MNHASCRATVGLPVLAFLVSMSWVGNADADPVVWTGPTVTFSKMGEDDPTLPQYQDRLTDNVWLSRGSIEGMFNIAPGKETAYVRFTSPDDTEWATGVIVENSGQTVAAANWQQLTFTTWAAAYGGPGPGLADNITTRNAVVHLVTDDIYLDLMFTGFDSSGLVAYERSTPVPEPAAVGLVLLGLFTLRFFRNRRS
jgi:hypothetical protein